jgi:hypothetical protein
MRKRVTKQQPHPKYVVFRDIEYGEVVVKVLRYIGNENGIPAYEQYINVLDFPAAARFIESLYIPE